MLERTEQGSSKRRFRQLWVTQLIILQHYVVLFRSIDVKSFKSLNTSSLKSTPLIRDVREAMHRPPRDGTGRTEDGAMQSTMLALIADRKQM